MFCHNNCHIISYFIFGYKWVRWQKYHIFLHVLNCIHIIEQIPIEVHTHTTNNNLAPSNLFARNSVLFNCYSLFSLGPFGVLGQSYHDCAHNLLKYAHKYAYVCTRSHILINFQTAERSIQTACGMWMMFPHNVGIITAAVNAEIICSRKM